MTDMRGDLPGAGANGVSRAVDDRPPLPTRSSFECQGIAATRRLWNEAADADLQTLERVAEGLRGLSTRGHSDHPQREIDCVIARWRYSREAGHALGTPTTRDTGEVL